LAPAAAAGEPGTTTFNPGRPANEPQIDLHRALSGQEVVLFSLNSSRYGTLAAQLGTLVIQDLVSAAGRRIEEAAAGSGSGAREVAFVGLDEFSALGADHVVSLFARGREAGLCTFAATQELVDLDRAAPGLRDQVLGNTAVKIVHRQDVPASAQLIAQLAGTEKVWERTQQLVGRLLAYDSGRGTRRQVEQFIVHPNEIKALASGEAIMITKLPTTRVQRVRVSPPRALEPGARSAGAELWRSAGAESRSAGAESARAAGAEPSRAAGNSRQLAGTPAGPTASLSRAHSDRASPRAVRGSASPGRGPLDPASPRAAPGSTSPSRGPARASEPPPGPKDLEL
jgi:hypothetical protein